MTQGIYCIRNLKNGKRYIGQSKNVEKRIKRHFKKSSNRHLRAAIEKYGEDSFEDFLLEEVISDAKLDEREQYWIDSFLWDELYNFAKIAGSMKGFSYTEDQKKRIWNKERKIKISKTSFNTWNSKSRFFYEHQINLQNSDSYDTISESRLSSCTICGYRKFSWQFVRLKKEHDNWEKSPYCTDCYKQIEEEEELFEEQLKGVFIPHYETPVKKYKIEANNEATF